MTPFAQLHGDFTRADLDLLRDAVTIVDAIPDAPKGKPPVRCHEVARVVAYFLGGVRVVDCKYGAMEHTVLLVRGEKHRDSVILDPYCPGRVPPVQLVYQFTGTPAAATYRSTGPRTDIRIALVAATIRAVERETGLKRHGT